MFKSRQVIDYSPESITLPSVNRMDYMPGEVVETAQPIEEHTPDQSIEADGYECNLCGFVSKNEQGMKTHISRKHSSK